MKVSDKGLIELVCSEGIVPYPYLDSVGVWTYGVGHTRAAGAPDPATMPKGVATSLTGCIELFRRDLAKYERAVLNAVKVPLKQHEFDALVHRHYNTGAIATATLTRKLNAGDRRGAADQFLVWVKQPELKPRRQKERALFLIGTYSNNGKALIYTADKNGKLGKATSQSVAELLWLVPDVAKAPPVMPGSDPSMAPATITKDEPIKPPGFWSSLLVMILSAFKKRG